LWSLPEGQRIPPWKWRRNGGKPPVSEGDGCDIKRNINNKGVRIYHVPGQRYYQATQINTSKGERWFCTEDEARAAGWRRARTP